MTALARLILLWEHAVMTTLLSNRQPANIGDLITTSPVIRGGRPIVAGTGVTVQRVVGWYKLGLTPEEISDRLGHLSLAQVHAALAYFHANRDQIEAQITADEAEGDRLEHALFARQMAA